MLGLILGAKVARGTGRGRKEACAVHRSQCNIVSSVLSDHPNRCFCLQTMLTSYAHRMLLSLLVEDVKAEAMTMLAETLRVRGRPHFQDVFCFPFHHFSRHIWFALQSLFSDWYSHARFAFDAC